MQFFESDNIPVFSVGGTYNGKKGYYDGQKPVGNISYQLVNSMNPDYMEINYAVTDLPTEIPVFIDIQTDNSLSKWNPGPAKLNPPDQSYFFIVGTFPAFTNSNIAISNDYVTRSGIDFNCDGDWLKVDANGNIVGGGGMVNKIAVRKTAPVLPGGILTAITVTKVANTGMMEPAAIKTNQVQNKQLPGAVQKARIRN